MQNCEYRAAPLNPTPSHTLKAVMPAVKSKYVGSLAIVGCAAALVGVCILSLSVHPTPQPGSSASRNVAGTRPSHKTNSGTAFAPVPPSIHPDSNKQETSSQQNSRPLASFTNPSSWWPVEALTTTSKTKGDQTRDFVFDFDESGVVVNPGFGLGLTQIPTTLPNFASFQTKDLILRPCAGILIFNSLGQILAAERIRPPVVWQFAQGGIDEGESAADAANREMFEELGLQDGKNDISYVTTLPQSLVYTVAAGTLIKEKYNGQIVTWSIFHYSGQDMPLVTLTGLAGSEPEFSRVQWMEWDDFLKGVRETKLEMYKQLQQQASPIMEPYLVSQFL